MRASPSLTGNVDAERSNVIYGAYQSRHGADSES